MKKIFNALVYLALLTGCTTIYFDNGPERKNETKSEPYSVWHHDFVFGLVEATDPVDLNKSCDGHDWSSVRVELDVPQAIIHLIPYVSAVYSPWDVRYFCDASGTKPTKK